MRVGGVTGGSEAPYLMWLQQLQQMSAKKKAGNTGLLGLIGAPFKAKTINPLQGVQQLSAPKPFQQAKGPQRIDLNALSVQISTLARQERFDISLLQIEGTKYLVGPGSLEIQKYNYIQMSGNSNVNQVEGVLNVSQVGALVDGYA